MNSTTIREIMKGTPRVFALVMIGQGGDYRRYQGRALTNHVIVDGTLTCGEVESFRRKPASFIALFNVMAQ